MPRRPEVFVRELTPDEAERLVRITRTARDRVRLRRAGIVLASVQGRSAAEAAAMFAAKPQYAREVIHAFNTQGFAALDPKWSGGRPPRFGPHIRELICRVARTPPQQAGMPFTTWSLSKLVEHLRQRHRIAVSAETVRQILRTAGVRWQATKTWKASRDPQFSEKMHRILNLYDRCAAGQIPDGGRVICVDEFGPLNLQPRPGRGWFPTGSPARLRATYNRYGGVRHMLAGLDLGLGPAALPITRPEALAGVPGLPAPAPTPVPHGAALRRLRQLLPAPQGRGRRLVRRPRRRAGVHPDPRLLAELDRVGVHRAALLHPRRQRLPLPRRAGSCHRRLHPLGQQARPAEATLRSRVQDPQTGLPTERCLTRH